ncbi:P-loop ATPase, Sll1717 family [Cellulomonas sp. PS-H5]|uniref:P-loop ATPase, Sll1717 family n=1 Tax=Cellulomonas sp. PS-H5 TaxID=2820400 RepID=UPI001C4FF57B|nr:hypothetical protein [Cellulomonas sp. PS-H5]MBW0255984.1 hypothetical protein [Cellulomonas sp. PS-H5]
MPSRLPAFKDLHFGHLDASQEAVEEPDLLRDGYYDYREAVYGISVRHTWLLLGPKGSGKSAVLESIRLNWESDPQRFFTYWDLGKFPVNDVTRIAMGQSAGASRTQAAWEFLLLLRVIESLDRDQGLTCAGSFTKMVKGLKGNGLLSGDWISRVARWAGTTVKFDAKILGIESQWTPDSVTPLDVSAYVREQLATVETSSKHIIALDGLDSFFFEAEDEWTSLAGLTSALYSLNRELLDLRLPVVVVAAIRSDILDVLPGPEVTKLKPHSVHLDWHANGIGAKNHLWTLLSRKAGVRHPDVRDLVTQYLQTPVAIGPHSRLPEFLLDNTRLLPRDTVALMGFLQKCYLGNNHVTEGAAKRAVQLYAEQYFVSEIFDNLAGVLPAGSARHIGAFRDALRTAPSRFFDITYLRDELEGDLEAPQIKMLLKQMFETGGIGIRNGQYTDFVFRKVSGAGFTTRHQFMLHDALTRAWNRPWK